MSYQATPCPRRGQVEANRSTRRPYAQLPHDIAADPRLTPTDVAILLALTFFARDKDHCWPCDRTLGSRVGRSRATVQRRLRHLEFVGYVGREKTDANATGRILRLLWRVTSETPPQSSARQAPRSPVRHELEDKNGKEKPSPLGPEGPSPARAKAETPMTLAEREAMLKAMGLLDVPAGHPLAHLATRGLSGPPGKSLAEGLTIGVRSWRPG